MVVTYLTVFQGYGIHERLKLHYGIILTILTNFFGLQRSKISLTFGWDKTDAEIV
jgi:hypothetical protein